MVGKQSGPLSGPITAMLQPRGSLVFICESCRTGRDPFDETANTALLD
jgi:hypothetical protein